MSYASESKMTPMAFLDGDAADVTPQLKNEAYHINIMQPVTITRLLVLVTGLADSDACIITFTRRLLPNDETGAVALGTITLSSTAAKGKLYYKDITPQQADAGDEIKIVSSNAGGAVKMRCSVEMFPRPETPANNADMVASA